LLAEQMLDAAALRELLAKKVGPAAKREGVAHLQAALGLSERRACSIVNADRKMIRYRSCRPPDTELRTHLRALANERKRFGYRRLFVLRRDAVLEDWLLAADLLQRQLAAFVIQLLEPVEAVATISHH